MSSRRGAYEIELAKALGRYVGYTSGAYDLLRIAGLVEYTRDRPAIYDVEIMHRLQDEFGVSAKYAKGILEFACSLQFLRRTGTAGPNTRISDTALGRSYRAAKELNLGPYQQFLLSYSLLENDADVYLLLLDILARSNDDTQSYVEEFRNRTRDLRLKRISWLDGALASHRLRERIADRVPWIQVHTTGLESDPVGRDYPRHHATPRRGWAKSVGHLTDKDRVTDDAVDLLQKGRPEEGEYFWIGPSKECLEELQIDASLWMRPLGPTWEILRPSEGPTDAPDKFLLDLSEFMVDAYDSLRLTKSNQAPLDAVRPYILYLESVSGVRVNTERVLESLFRHYRSTFAPMSGQRETLGYYQLRNK